MRLHTRRVRTILILSALSALVLCSGAAILRAIVNDLTLVETLHPANTEHLDQGDLLALVQADRKSEAFTEAFEHGDELFETDFNAAAGVGANVGDGSRFTRVPRADLTAAGQWATHSPKRATGPNAVSCAACHEQPFDDGSGAAVSNVHRDPEHSGSLKQFIQRNTPHVFALGALQRLAEEMTGELQLLREAAGGQACSFGTATRPLVAKGVGFGAIKATRVGSNPCRVTFDTSLVSGVSADLIVRPFQWKGTVKTVREFNRDAAHNELGMQAVEFTGDNVDGDGDGVVNELSVGDITALTLYLAAQPRPTTKLELARHQLIDPLSPAEVASINAGARVFGSIGCASCHVPQLLLNDPVFSEPSGNPQYRDGLFPAGQNARDRGVHPRFPVSFDLTRDQPDNRILDENGVLIYALGSFVRDTRGRAIIELFSDLKRHNMGSRLAEAIDEEGTGAASFLTRTLWGAGSSGPYLHDGRATTLTEAILEHGGEAAGSRNAFIARPLADKQALIAFIDNLVLFKMEENEVVVPPPTTVQLSSTLRMRMPAARPRP
jgi:cytochrome c553